MVLDASWNGQQMHVTKLLVDSPNIKLVRSNAPKPPVPAGANPEGTTMLANLSVDDAQIKNGTVTLATAGQTGAAVYQQLNAQITNLTPKTSSPFSVSGHLPGGGSINADGKVTFNQANNAATPLNAQVTLKHVELGSSGILPPDAGIGGIADLQAQVQSDGQTLNATGSTQIAGIKLAKDGQPSAKPVQLQFAVAQNEQAMTGQLQKATFTVGRATINASGTYQESGPTTAINLKVIGDSVPIDELVAFLPALGVRLPQGSQLKGGTLTTALTVSGSSANPVISGPLSVNNTQLAGFDYLGSKLQTLSQLTGRQNRQRHRLGNQHSVAKHEYPRGRWRHTDRQHRLGCGGCRDGDRRRQRKCRWGAQLQRGSEAYRLSRRRSGNNAPAASAGEAKLRFLVDSRG